MVEAMKAELLACVTSYDVRAVVDNYQFHLQRLNGWRFPDARRQAWYDAACEALAETEYQQECYIEQCERGGYSPIDR